MVCFLNRKKRGVTSEWEMNTREAASDYRQLIWFVGTLIWRDSRDQVSLELIQVHVETTIESQRSSNARNHLYE